MRKALPCPNCNCEFSPKELLEESSIAWPELQWIYFKCPNCGKQTHILVEDNRIATVDFLGAPGPDWKINTPMLYKDLKVRIDPSFIHVWLDGIHYEFEEQK